MAPVWGSILRRSAAVSILFPLMTAGSEADRFETVHARSDCPVMATKGGNTVKEILTFLLPAKLDDRVVFWCRASGPDRPACSDQVEPGFRCRCPRCARPPKEDGAIKQGRWGHPTRIFPGRSNPVSARDFAIPASFKGSAGDSVNPGVAISLVSTGKRRGEGRSHLRSRSGRRDDLALGNCALKWSKFG